MVRNCVPWSTKNETEDMIRWFDYFVPSHWLSADLLKIRLVSYSRSSSGCSGLTGALSIQPLTQSTSEQQWKWQTVVQLPTVYRKKYSAPEHNERVAAAATTLLAANVNLKPKPRISVALGSLFGLSIVPWWLCFFCFFLVCTVYSTPALRPERSFSPEIRLQYAACVCCQHC